MKIRNLKRKNLSVTIRGDVRATFDLSREENFQSRAFKPGQPLTHVFTSRIPKVDLSPCARAWLLDRFEP